MTTTLENKQIDEDNTSHNHGCTIWILASKDYRGSKFLSVHNYLTLIYYYF